MELRALCFRYAKNNFINLTLMLEFSFKKDALKICKTI